MKEESPNILLVTSKQIKTGVEARTHGSQLGFIPYHTACCMTYEMISFYFKLKKVKRENDTKKEVEIRYYYMKWNYLHKLEELCSA